jgi:hypothetical protein
MVRPLYAVGLGPANVVTALLVPHVAPLIRLASLAAGRALDDCAGWQLRDDIVCWREGLTTPGPPAGYGLDRSR